jgi:hypothetical protein
MKIIAEDLHNDADIVLEEILDDIGVHEYFWPKSDIHTIFEQAYMKFLNGNLNYFNFPNMIAHALIDGNTFNEAFPKTIDFCERVRTITGNTGPFGRMCVWNLPPGKRLLPHVDNFDYHRQIVRNIFIVSENINDTLEIRIRNTKVKIDKGTLFQFFPARQLHTFINKSENPFYFLGFDYWYEDNLAKESTKFDLESIVADPERYSSYGFSGSKCKYMSEH